MQDLAAEQGCEVDDVLAAARRAGVLVWSAGTPLDDREDAAIRAELGAANPPDPPRWPRAPGP